MSSFPSITDPEADQHIRKALRLLDEDGKLPVLAAITGIAGGEDELRRIMNDTEEMAIIDRGMLLLHLSNPF